MSAIVDALNALVDRIERVEKAVKAPERDSWTVTEVSKKLGIPYDTVLTLIHTGELGHVRAGRYYLVPELELQRLLAAGINNAA
jgi:excisionase family DNA binding protein